MHQTMDSKEVIIQLAEIFREYKIYPKECFIVNNSPVKVFMEMIQDDPYSKDLDTFISRQDYKSTHGGADLPWWGKKYFLDEKGFRIFIVAQDSNYTEAGSVVFFSHLFPYPDRLKEYKSRLKRIALSKTTFNNLKKIREIFIDWGINFDFLYITDAAKVYMQDSIKVYDLDKSKKLLQKEIDLCKPDLIVLLGKKALRILDKKRNYKEDVDSGKPVSIAGNEVVVAPFPIGQGSSNPPTRFENAKSLIKKAMK